VLGRDRKATGEHGRRSQAAGTTGALVPANWQFGLGNERLEELWWCRRKGAVHSRSHRASREEELVARPTMAGGGSDDRRRLRTRGKAHELYSRSLALERRFASQVVGPRHGIGAAWRRARSGTAAIGLVGRRWMVRRGLRARARGTGQWAQKCDAQGHLGAAHGPMVACVPRRPGPVGAATWRRTTSARVALSGRPGYKTFCPGIL
jgi:hypothetical protein